MKKHLKFIITIFLLLSFLIFYACDGEGYVIKFFNGDELYHLVYIQDLENFEIPSDPEKDEFVFDGWYLDDGIWEQPFDISILEKGIRDISVYAKWKPLSHEDEDGDENGENDNQDDEDDQDDQDDEDDQDDQDDQEFTTYDLEALWNRSIGVFDEIWEDYFIIEPHEYLSVLLSSDLETMYPNEYLKNADVVIRDQMWLIYAVECEEEHIEGMLEYLNGTLNYESSLFYSYSQYKNSNIIFLDHIFSLKELFFDKIKIQDGLYYTKETIIRYKGTNSSMDIQDGIKNIGFRAFYNCPNLEQVTFPDSLEYIGGFAFEGCALNSVSIPDSVKVLVNNAFAYCGNLTQVEINEESSLEAIGVQAFMGCSELTSIFIPEKVKALCWDSFCSCPKLAQVTFADNSQLEYIGNQAFTGNTSITQIIIPEGTRHIGGYAFSGNDKLSSIELPDSVEYIGERAFQFCSVLSEISLPSNLKSIQKETFNYAGLTQIVIPEGVEEIGEKAFMFCSKLKSVSLPSTLKSIGKNPFSYCMKLETIEISEDNQFFKVEDNVLYDFGVTKLIKYPSKKEQDTFTLPQSVQIICEEAFGSNNSIQHIVVSNDSDLTTIGERAFSECKNLQSITFGENSSVADIQRGAFYECVNLNDVVIPDGVTKLEPEVFFFCHKLTQVHIPESVTFIDFSVFYDCGFENIDLPSGLTYIGESAFGSCNNLKTITIPASVTTIKGMAFQVCKNLEEVIFEEGSQLEEIGYSVFVQCEALTSITLPQSLLTIGTGVFERCYYLIEVEIKAQTPPVLGENAFNETNEGLIIYVPQESLLAYNSAEGWKELEIATRD
ncbi:MAG TPA: leucine-rich repeat protein [Clostridiales bacterium]|jgi:uncharacterized repeat protein (TIGR02543 family)|nr:leucine-rich repeat protein [Clostridiales bacterium]